MKRFIEFASYNFVRIWRFTVIDLGCMHTSIYSLSSTPFSAFSSHTCMSQAHISFCFAVLMADWPAALVTARIRIE